MVLIMVGLGLATYLYGTAVCKGALLANMDKKQVTFSLGVPAFWQIIVLALGNFAAARLHAMEITKSEYPMNAFVCLMIFGVMAVQMLIHVVKNEPIEEKRIKSKDFYRSMFKLCLTIGFYIFLTGFAFGLLQTEILQELIVLVGFSAVGMLGGLFTGYRFGYGQRNGAYIVGGIFLMIGSVFLFLQYFIS